MVNIAREGSGSGNAVVVAIGRHSVLRAQFALRSGGIVWNVEQRKSLLGSGLVSGRLRQEKCQRYHP